jgi:hypothetical protein
VTQLLERSAQQPRDTDLRDPDARVNLVLTQLVVEAQAQSLPRAGIGGRDELQELTRASACGYPSSSLLAVVASSRATDRAWLPPGSLRSPPPAARRRLT